MITNWEPEIKQLKPVRTKNYIPRLVIISNQQCQPKGGFMAG